MDKYEFKLKVDEMKALVSARNYNAAAEIAETINWRKIRNLNALVLAGEVFEQVERYEESKEILLMAYDKSPIGRNIIYRLAEIAIKTKHFDEAQEYYDEFVDIAPHDNLKYVLKYKMTAAQGLSFQEQIQILEELKEQEYSEEWAYELAYLYYRDGQPEKCVEACDELILWFGDGIYVEKALELKMHYQPLTKQQEDKYRLFRQKRTGVIEVRPNDFLESGEIVNEIVEIPAVSTNTGQYNTANLQEEIAKGIQQMASSAQYGPDMESSVRQLAEENPYLSFPKEQNQKAARIRRLVKMQETADLVFGSDSSFWGAADPASGGGAGIQEEQGPASGSGAGMHAAGLASGGGAGYEETEDEPEESPPRAMSFEEIQAEWEKTKLAMQNVLQEAAEHESRNQESRKRRMDVRQSSNEESVQHSRSQESVWQQPGSWDDEEYEAGGLPEPEQEFQDSEAVAQSGRMRVPQAAGYGAYHEEFSVQDFPGREDAERAYAAQQLRPQDIPNQENGGAGYVSQEMSGQAYSNQEGPLYENASQGVSGQSLSGQEGLSYENASQGMNGQGLPEQGGNERAYISQELPGRDYLNQENDSLSNAAQQMNREGYSSQEGLPYENASQGMSGQSLSGQGELLYENVSQGMNGQSFPEQEGNERAYVSSELSGQDLGKQENGSLSNAAQQMNGEAYSNQEGPSYVNAAQDFSGRGMLAQGFQNLEDMQEEADRRLDMSREKTLSEAEVLMERLMGIVSQISAGMSSGESQDDGLVKDAGTGESRPPGLQNSLNQAGMIVASMNKLLQEQIDSLMAARKQSQPANVHRVSDPTRELPKLPDEYLAEYGMQAAIDKMKADDNESENRDVSIMDGQGAVSIMEKLIAEETARSADNPDKKPEISAIELLQRVRMESSAMNPAQKSAAEKQMMNLNRKAPEKASAAEGKPPVQGNPAAEEKPSVQAELAAEEKTPGLKSESDFRAEEKTPAEFTVQGANQGVTAERTAGNQNQGKSGGYAAESFGQGKPADYPAENAVQGRPADYPAESYSQGKAADYPAGSGSQGAAAEYLSESTNQQILTDYAAESPAQEIPMELADAGMDLEVQGFARAANQEQELIAEYPAMDIRPEAQAVNVTGKSEAVQRAQAGNMTAGTGTQAGNFGIRREHIAGDFTAGRADSAENMAAVPGNQAGNIRAGRADSAENITAADSSLMPEMQADFSYGEAAANAGYYQTEMIPPDYTAAEENPAVSAFRESINPSAVQEAAGNTGIGFENDISAGYEASFEYEKTVQNERKAVHRVKQQTEEISEEDMALAAQAAGFYEQPRQTTIQDDSDLKKLTPEQKKVFSYFVPVSGMEVQIYDLLQGVSEHLRFDKNALSGNIIVEGIGGNGKTVLIMDIIKVLQKEIKRPNGKIGKIDANALNQKDMDVLTEKISGGCLIIESAGKITRETAVKLSRCMENDHVGTLYILEDTEEGIQKALERDSSFAAKFTEKISIPLFTIDELAAFGKAYAYDLNYEIDEMGILALYKRIGNIQKLDHVTTLTEVKEIVDEAIDNAEKGVFKKVFGILTATRANDDNYVILREKDFEE